MSTFDGKVKEFPDIRIDYFRVPETARRPLAFFLSHVHSDHLAGLETCRAPFIYSSPATKEILLRLEKYPHRMNFAKGILETRKQTYRNLRKLLKPIPLETPTVLELAPGKEIRVTLFDANHCVGAVMFLIEGQDKAVLYTGDIRSESWWVKALQRHPLLIPYVPFGKSQPLKRLDTIYLDTTFANKADPSYKVFPSKAEGLGELLNKLSQYPKGTNFYFDAWTFGYEDVWQTLSTFLGEQMHVDDYRYSLYRALANGTEPKAPEASRLIGFNRGNHIQPGCLTTDKSTVHSCEKGTGCEIWNSDFVRITPLISRHGGREMFEPGAGGGLGDLDQRHELEFVDQSSVGELIALCVSELQSKGQKEDLEGVMCMLTSMLRDGTDTIELEATTFVDGTDEATDMQNLPLTRLVPALVEKMMKKRNLKLDDLDTARHGNGNCPQVSAHACSNASVEALGLGALPKRILFPYSRHSSYSELCELIEVFRPRDIYPCTVDYKHWKPTSSMGYLFGHLYPGAHAFTHDTRMLRQLADDTRNTTERYRRQRQDATGEDGSAGTSPRVPSVAVASSKVPHPIQTKLDFDGASVGDHTPSEQVSHDESKMQTGRKRSSAALDEAEEGSSGGAQRRRVSVDHHDLCAHGDMQANLHYTSQKADIAAPGIATRLFVGNRDDSRDGMLQRTGDALPREDRPHSTKHRVSAHPSISGEDVTHTAAARIARSLHGHQIVRPSAETCTSTRDVDDGEHDISMQRERLPKLSRTTASSVTVSATRNTVDLPAIAVEGHDVQVVATSPTPLLSSPTARTALQEECYYAAIGMSDVRWSDVSLVSVRGHQVKEEEL